MRIATLMINGFDKKLPKFLSWLKQPNAPDIVALQKIGNAADFPESALHKIGYHSIVNKPCPQDFGVAILTRIARGEPKERFRVLPGADRDGARLLTVEIAGLLVSSVYAPYGNPNKWEKELGNRRLAHERAIDVRVAWLRRLREHLHEKGYAGRDSLLCGDFNVKTKSDGPPKGSAYSEREQDELEKLLKLGFSDLYDQYRRDHSNVPEGFTFGFTKENPRTGSSRLHLAIASKGLAERLVCASVDIEADIRKEARPLVVEFSDPG